MEFNRSKYRNIPTTRKVKGTVIRFPSQKEACRYDELILMLRAGKIRNLKLQPEYTLQEAFTTPEGERVKALRYRADFSYEKWGTEPVPEISQGTFREVWLPVIEDVKGARTKVYLMKRKLMQEKGLEVTEV